MCEATFFYQGYEYWSLMLYEGHYQILSYGVNSYLALYFPSVMCVV